MSDAKDDAPPRFEAVIGELETLVGRLERDDLDLDEALALYERGVALARTGNQLLDGAERRVETLQQSFEENR